MQINNSSSLLQCYWNSLCRTHQNDSQVKIWESLRANMEAIQAKVYLRFLRQQLFIDFHSTLD